MKFYSIEHQQILLAAEEIITQSVGIGLALLTLCINIFDPSTKIKMLENN